jgi:hypothetical protein
LALDCVEDILCRILNLKAIRKPLPAALKVVMRNINRAGNNNECGQNLIIAAFSVLTKCQAPEQQKRDQARSLPTNTG